MVNIPLAETLTQGDAIVAVTREDTAAEWTYLAATLSSDGSSAELTTDHFSLFGILLVDVEAAASAFKQDFLDGLSGGATATDVEKPRCENEAEARQDGYSITSTTTDTVYWCFGMQDGQRILKVVDHRRYPLQALHPNMSTISTGSDWGQWSSLSRLISGDYAIIAPGGTTVFNADLAPGTSEGISTEMDGLGQSLYALQTGVSALVSILTRFGAGGPSKAEAADKFLMVQSCITAVGKGSGALISGCFSPKALVDALGVKGLLLAPVMALGGVLSFFRSEWNGLVDLFTGHDQYDISIARKASPPLLGLPWGPYQEGFGSVAPTRVFNGGDPTGLFDITWDNWGGPTADGHGTALWVGPEDAGVADGDYESASFRAFGLGTCQGQQVYLHLAVWFPQYGEQFDPATNGEAFYTLCPE